MDTEEPPVPLPSARSAVIAPRLTLQPPLSRRGHGPGLVLVTSVEHSAVDISDSLDPLPLQKWAEEGYAVVQILFSKTEFAHDLAESVKALIALPECDDKENMGLIIYSCPDSFVVGKAVSVNDTIVASISYHGFLDLPRIPQLLHIPGVAKKPSGANQLTSYQYPQVKSESFIIPGHVDFVASAAAVAHTRSLTFLKKHMQGPFFDLESIWEEHTYFEFENRSVANTMGTMVQEPYVNHIPTMTGGIGRERLSNFYRYHFIWNNPDDTVLDLVSRTVGIDRIVDEFIFSFTHDKVIDWLIPGIPPTGKRLRIPMMCVVNVRGDRLYHEHITWDQATVLVQLCLLPEYLPYPYPLTNGQIPGPGKRFEFRVPAAGVETAEKLLDETAVASNAMFEFGIREVDIVSI